MVFGPMKILRFSRMASRTSDSHTNGTGAGGAADFGGTGGVAFSGAGAVSQV